MYQLRTEVLCYRVVSAFRTQILCSSLAPYKPVAVRCVRCHDEQEKRLIHALCFNLANATMSRDGYNNVQNAISYWSVHNVGM